MEKDPVLPWLCQPGVPAHSGHREDFTPLLLTHGGQPQQLRAATPGAATPVGRSSFPTQQQLTNPQGLPQAAILPLILLALLQQPPEPHPGLLSPCWGQEASQERGSMFGEVLTAHGGSIFFWELQIQVAKASGDGKILFPATRHTLPMLLQMLKPSILQNSTLKSDWKCHQQPEPQTPARLRGLWCLAGLWAVPGALQSPAEPCRALAALHTRTYDGEHVLVDVCPDVDAAPALRVVGPAQAGHVHHTALVHVHHAGWGQQGTLSTLWGHRDSLPCS